MNETVDRSGVEWDGRFSREPLTSDDIGDLKRELARQYAFEACITDLSVRVANLRAHDVDALIEDVQRRFCEALNLDSSALFQIFEGDPAGLLLTHLYQRGDVVEEMLVEKRVDARLRSQVYSILFEQNTDYPRKELDAKTLFPWFFEKLRQREPIILSSLNDLPEDAGQDKETLKRFDTKSTVVMPLASGGTFLGCVFFASSQAPRNWSDIEVRRFRFIADLLTNALLRKRTEEALGKSYAEIQQLKDRLQAESDYLKSEIKVSHAHGQIIGHSKAIKRVLHDVEQVSLADCPVLITGETGTGKELIAQEIHHLSLRNKQMMVLVNCAALPSALVESELFGRERGAYTGALTSQVGRFEIADGSTIFLDEVGELSLEVQAKLLRVLQQGEFQRLGSPKTHKVDVRVIAATNRDLAEEVRKGRFREDLYYRLNVFPVAIPPLRERKEDIPLLVFAFMEEFATRMGKKITRLPRKAMETLQTHHWPGNIRELRNVIEHSVILTSADTLKVTGFSESPTREAQPVTLADAEREHILRSLESTNWRIKGPHGAAKRLALQPSTLYSRMQKLGIPHRRQKDEMASVV